MVESSIKAKHRTTIPKAVRAALALEPGDGLRHVIVDQGALIMPVRPTNRLFGSLGHAGEPLGDC